MNFDMYTMERRLEMTLPVQTNLNTSIGSTRLVTFTEHTVNTYRYYYRTAGKFIKPNPYQRPHYIGAEYGFIRGIQWGGEIQTMGRNLPVKFIELHVNIMIPC
jgi:hypothetical protein